MKKLCRIYLLLFMFAFITSSFVGCAENNNKAMYVDFLDVGDADCSLVYNTSHIIVIDTGLSDTSDYVCECIKNRNFTSIDLLVISHYDKDHIGGAAEIIKNFDVKKEILPDYKADNDTSDEYISLISALEKYDIDTTYVFDEEHFTIDDITLEIYGTNGKNYKDDTDNNSSLIAYVTHADDTFLFAGDIEKDRIKDLLSSEIKKCDVLKTPHHGAYNKKTESYIKTLSPRYAVVCCDDENTADQKLVALLDKLEIKAYFTSKGKITMCSQKGQSIIIEAYIREEE